MSISKTIYIKRNIGTVEYDFELDPNSYNVGHTYEDYLNGAWILLTPEHLKFKEKNPSCSISELCNLRMNVPYITPEADLIEIAKINKINHIDQYDQSDKVNQFYLNGHGVWLDKSMRVGLMNSIQIEKSVGREESTLWFNDVCYTVPIDIAIHMLQELELYALACYNKTAEHKVAVNALEDIDSVKAYDYTKGYPTKLSFNTIDISSTPLEQ